MNERECNSKETHAIEYLAALDCQLRQSEPHLKERLQSIPGAWQKYRTAMTFIEKVIDGVYETVPIKLLLHMQKLCEYGEVIIRPRPVVRTGEVQIIKEDDLKVLINKAIENECSMCLASGADVRHCPLRKTLMNIAPPADLKSSLDCPYQDVTLRCKIGKYI